MSTYRLDKLVLAAIRRRRRRVAAQDVVRSRRARKSSSRAGFPGTIHLVNPHYDEIEGVRAVKSYDALPEAPDVVVIAVPPAAVPDAVAAAARKGTAAGIIVTAGLGHGPGSLAELCEKNARAAGHAPRRSQLSRRAGAARKAQCQLCRLGAARRAISR